MERYRTTLIMLGLLIALGVAALLVNSSRTGTVVTPTPEPVQYVWESTEPVVGLDVVSGTARVVLSQGDTLASWKIEQPVQGEADSFAVATIADAFKSLQAASVLTEATNLADFGLDKPGLTVTATYSGTTSPKVLLVGGPTFDGAGYYTKLPDSGTVYVVSNGTIEPLRSWLAAPPLAPPTATPPQLTIAPTASATPPTSPTVIGGTTVPASSTITTTEVITGSNPITSTSPGAANPTTPLPVGSPVP